MSLYSVESQEHPMSIHNQVIPAYDEANKSKATLLVYQCVFSLAADYTRKLVLVCTQLIQYHMQTDAGAHKTV